MSERTVNQNTVKFFRGPLLLVFASVAGWFSGVSTTESHCGCQDAFQCMTSLAVTALAVDQKNTFGLCLGFLFEFSGLFVAPRFESGL